MRKQRSDTIRYLTLSLFILIKLGMVIYLPHIILYKVFAENQEYTNNSKEKKFSTKKRILLVDDELDIT